MRPALLLTIVFLAIPTAVHSFFHLLDWAVWGVGMDSTEIRHLLLPYFQDDTYLGLAAHAAVATSVLVLVGILFAIVIARGRQIRHLRIQLALARETKA